MRTPRSENGGRREGHARGCSNSSPTLSSVNLGQLSSQLAMSSLDASFQEWYLAQLANALRPPLPLLALPWDAHVKMKNLIPIRLAHVTSLHTSWNSCVDFYPSTFGVGLTCPQSVPCPGWVPLPIPSLPITFATQLESFPWLRTYVFCASDAHRPSRNTSGEAPPPAEK